MVRHIGRMAAIVLASGFVCALLVRYSPGTTVDERELNFKAGEGSLAAMRAKKADVGANLFHYLRGLAKGELGFSESNMAPIGGLIGDRAPATLRELAIGLAGGWVLGFAFAIPSGRLRRAPVFEALSATSAGLLLGLPAALIAYLCVLSGATSSTVLILVLAPRIFQFSKNLLRQAYDAAHVEMARARGVAETRIFWAHVLPSVGPQMVALAASSVSIAIGAAIPIEAICDVPGIGKLAWRAAMARDLPLLVNLTMLVAIAVTVCSAISEAVARPEVES